MILRSKTSYFVGYDFVIDINSRKDYKMMQEYIDRKPELEWLEDLRLPCISLVTNNDEILHVIQYTIHYGKLMERNTTIITYLDFGFIPVAFYPTCYTEVNKVIDRQIEALGVNVYKFPAIYAGDVRFRTAHTDSWVSRVEMSSILGMPPEKIKTPDILRRLFQYETA